MDITTIYELILFGIGIVALERSSYLIAPYYHRWMRKVRRSC